MKRFEKFLNLAVLLGFQAWGKKGFRALYLTMLFCALAAPVFAQSLADVAPLKNYIVGLLSVLAMFFSLKIGKDMMSHYSAMSEGTDPGAKQKFFMSLAAIVGIWSIPFIVNLIITRAKNSGLTDYQNMIPN